MKRRWLAALLTVAMTAGVLSGCGGGSNNAGTTDTAATEAPADSQENSGGVIRKRLRLRQKEKHRQMQRM